jgi:hypothetical protein
MVKQHHFVSIPGAVLWMSFWPIKQEVSWLPFPILVEDRKNQKHGPVLQSMRTSQVFIIVLIYKSHFMMFLRHNTLRSLLPSSLATSSPSASQSSSPLFTSTTTESRATTLNILQSLVRQPKDFTFRWLINLKFSKVKLAFRCEINAHNLIESPKFLHRNKIINIVNMNAKRNFQISGPCSQLWSCHVWRVSDKNEKVEGQKCYLAECDSVDAANIPLQPLSFGNKYQVRRKNIARG